jgi:hypothetical protein
MNRHVGLKLTHPQFFRIGLSDHTAFYTAKVPVMYLFGGMHEDHNSPRDTPERLEMEKVRRVALLAFLTGYAVADREERILFKAEPDDAGGLFGDAR